MTKLPGVQKNEGIIAVLIQKNEGIALAADPLLLLLHLFSHDPVLVPVLEIGTFVEAPLNKKAHLILIQIHLADVVTVILVVNVIAAVFAVRGLPSSFPSHHTLLPGDRILCDFSMGSLRFGESGAVDGRALIHAAAKASDEIARMVILKNLRPLAIYDSERDGLPHSCEGPYKIRLELGWGDDKEKGFEWDTSVRCIGGKLKGYEPCICGRSVLSPSEDMKQNDNINRILFNASLTDDTFSFAVETYKNISPLHPQTSSAVIEVEGDKDTVLDFSINGRTERHTIKELLETSICGEVLSYASCSYKIHRAVPRSLYEVSMDIEDGGASGDFYHMEVYERNGHAAFVSPIFLL